MDVDRMLALAQALAAAKSRQDVPAALRLLHPGMVLETPAFGTTARGLADNERVLTRFFATFPDYDVVLDGHAANDDTLVCWGTARMTMTGNRLGVSPNGHPANLPVFIQFTFTDDRIASERFFFDLATLCAQSGVSTDAVRQRLVAEAQPAAVPGAAAWDRDPRVRDLGEITTKHLFDMVVDLHEPVSTGDGPYGRRVLFAAAGGRFDGASLRGEVLPVGGDWTLFRPDGAMALDVRLTLRTHDGALVHMTYGGRWIVPPPLRTQIADPLGRYQVDPARYYFRTNPLFETGDERYAWLNDIIGVGYGYLVDGGIAYKITQVQ